MGWKNSLLLHIKYYHFDRTYSAICLSSSISFKIVWIACNISWRDVYPTHTFTTKLQNKSIKQLYHGIFQFQWYNHLKIDVFISYLPIICCRFGFHCFKDILNVPREYGHIPNDPYLNIMPQAEERTQIRNFMEWNNLWAILCKYKQ